MTSRIGTVVYKDTPDARSRFAELGLNTDFEDTFNITLNGTDMNGDKVFPKFIQVDNFDNISAVQVTINGIRNTVAPYTRTTFEIAGYTPDVSIFAYEGTVKVYISETKLGIGDGTNDLAKDNAFNMGTYYSRDGSAAMLADVDMGGFGFRNFKDKSIVSAAIDVALTGGVSRSAQKKFEELPSIMDFGAVGDGVADDTLILQKMFDKKVSFTIPKGANIGIKSRLLISGNNITISGGGTISILPGWNFAADNGTSMRAIFVEGEYVSFQNITFDNPTKVMGSAVENGFVWSSAPWTSFKNCTFFNNPKGTCFWAMSAWGVMIGCTIVNCSGAFFARGRNPICSFNTIINATDAAIAFNGQACVGGSAIGNTLTNEAKVLLPNMIAMEEGASRWVIQGNTLRGANGGGISCLNDGLFVYVEGGVISDNVVDSLMDDQRLVSANPATLLNVSKYYRNCTIHGNKFIGCPSGNPASCMIQIGANGNLLHDNIIDGATATGLTSLTVITNGPGGLIIRNNTSIAGDGRHYTYGAGDYEGKICAHYGGAMYGGVEGINTQLNAGGILNLTGFRIKNLEECTVVNITNAANIIGSRSDFMNAGAWARDHSIGPITKMYANAFPPQAGVFPYQSGDTFYYFAPPAGGNIGFVRVPGDWKTFGVIQA